MTRPTTLGICIPTYKRPDFLRRCVISALDEAGDRPVRIFIADDSMDDTNAALYRELSQRSNNIVVHRNTANLGIDDNIQRAVDLCDCDYAWIVGEDDYFLPGAVQRIHDALQGETAPFIFANYAYVGDNTASHIRDRAIDDADGTLPAKDFIARHLWAAGFIGACIVHRERWGSTTTAPYKNTYYTHLGRICEMLSDNRTPVRLLATPCVANRVEGTDTFTWKRDSYGVFFGFVAMCEAVARVCPALAQASRQAALVMERRYGWLTLRLAMRLRSEHGYDLAQFRRYLGPHTVNPIKRTALYLISIAPPATFRPLVTAYRRLQRAQA